MSTHPTDALQALLRFYVEAGVDAALSEEPVDRVALSRQLAEEAKRTRYTRPPPLVEQQPADPISRDPAPQPGAAAPRLTIPSEAAVMAAREAAATAATLEELRSTLAGLGGRNHR